MSFQDELRRNRSVYARLAAGEAGGEPPVMRGEARDEWSSVPEARFLAQLEQAKSGQIQADSGEYQFAESAAARPAVYSLDAPASRAETRRFAQSETPDAAVREWNKYEAGRAAQARSAGEAARMQVDVEPVAYPDAGGASAAADGEDLLDSLLRRLETNARRYPQDLAQEGGATW